MTYDDDNSEQQREHKSGGADGQIFREIIRTKSPETLNCDSVLNAITV